MSRLSPVQIEILDVLFKEWAAPIMDSYRQNPGPLPPDRYWMALHQVLFGPLTLRQIVEKAKVRVSYGLLTVLRGQRVFKAVMTEHARNFADFLASKILEAGRGDFVKRLVFAEILVTLPGFDPCDNIILEALEAALKNCEADPQTGDFERLFEATLCCRDVLRLAHDRMEMSKKPAWEDKVWRRVFPLLGRIDATARAGLKVGLVEQGLFKGIDGLTLSIQFITNYSSIVV